MKYDTNIIFLHQCYFKFLIMSRLPILMYHNITPNSEESFDLTLSAQKFEDQLKYLKDHNFTSVFVSELENIDIISRK